jgi:hypothetical protein
VYTSNKRGVDPFAPESVHPIHVSIASKANAGNVAARNAIDCCRVHVCPQQSFWLMIHVPFDSPQLAKRAVNVDSVFVMFTNLHSQMHDSNRPSQLSSE